LALTDYITALEQKKDITSQLNKVYQSEESKIDTELIAMQVASLGGENW